MPDCNRDVQNGLPLNSCKVVTIKLFILLFIKMFFRLLELGLLLEKVMGENEREWQAGLTLLEGGDSKL